MKALKSSALALLSFVLSFQQQRMERGRNPRALQRVLKLSGERLRRRFGAEQEEE
jgi:hypothetical protein